jgi:signal transduction histidine kinase
MPKMSGYEVCEILKQDDAVSDIPVIFISALNNINDIVHAFEVGGVDYVTKPFQFEEVLARVKNHLTIIFQQRQLAEQSEQIRQMGERDKVRFKKVSQMREKFIQAATHDLKNPLAIIIGCADIMNRINEVRAHPHLRECVDNIQYASNEMLSLVTGMLDLVRMQSTFTLDMQSVNLTDFVGELVTSAKLGAKERNIELRTTSSNSSIPVRIDPNLMQRVVDNLISNAIKYSPDNTSIEVATVLEDNKVVIHVIDEGFGIDQEHISSVFEPFFRAKKLDGEREIEGTGLGLSIVKEIVEQHGGTVRVISTLDEGTTFSIYLHANL